METPGTDEGYDAVNVRRARLLLDGVLMLPTLSARALSARRTAARVKRPG
jgi:hypothetical protein